MTVGVSPLNKQWELVSGGGICDGSVMGFMRAYFSTDSGVYSVPAGILPEHSIYAYDALVL